MSVHINIRIPDEQAAAIDALGKSRSQAIIEALGAYIKQPTVIVAPQGKIKAMGGMRDRPKRLKAKRALGRTPENLSLADNRDARPAHALGCKCLMCQGK
jgi:hypothetical protein